MTSVDFAAALPISLVVLLALAVLAAESLVRKSEGVSYWLTVLGLAACGTVSAWNIPYPVVGFNGMLTGGGFAGFFSTLFIVAALFTVLLARDYLRKEHAGFGEFYLLTLFATVGMMLMASAGDLIVVFLGLELMSICLYVLAGFLRTRPLANESSLKYFLLGAFATGFFLYGVALLYGASGTTRIAPIVQNFGALSTSPFFWGGAGLLLIGLAFKVGAVPFHMWIPDVYQGSPTPVSGFMSTGAKAAAFSAFILVFAGQAASAGKLRLALALLAAASMLIGNLIALSQSNLKRMLAYSSVAHAGYMLAGLAAGSRLGRDGIVFYLVSYMFTNIGAFGVLSLLEKEEEKSLEFADYAGLGAKRPFLAALMTIFMLSLAGIPPFGGFVGKYYLFASAVGADLTWLAIFGVLMSLISVYYYLRLVVVMYFEDAPGEFARPPLQSLAVLAVAAAAVVELGVFPSPILSIITGLY